MKIKILVVSFINSAPLWWSLKDEKGIELSFAKPYKIAPLFKNGSYDIALMPTYEFVKNDFLLAAPLGVLSNGNVKSVLLFYKGNFSEVEKIHLDPNSRTSQAMTRFLFADIGMKFDKSQKELLSLEKNEAQLLIGDRALKMRNCGLKTKDIASLWKKKTNKSALFALWAKKSEKNNTNFESILEEGHKNSMRKLNQLIDRAIKKTEIDKRTLRDYFTKSLFYKFGREGKESLNFYKEVFGGKGY